MSQNIYSLTVIAFLSLILLIPSGSISFSQPIKNDLNAGFGQEPSIPGSYIVVLNEDVTNPEDVANEMALKNGLQISHVYSHALKGYSAIIPDSQLSKVMSDPKVKHVDADQIVSISKKPSGPPGGGTGDPSTPPSQETPFGIMRIKGDLSSTHSGDGSGSIDNVRVAVIDTGIYSHPDLNVAGGYNCSTGPSTNYKDGNGHGTHVSGTIAAKDNNFGVVGVAPGASLYAVRVLNNAGSGTWSSVICGIDWVAAHSDIIDVANMSLGGTGSEGATCISNLADPLHQAICNAVNAGVTFVVAAGNESDNSANHVPATYNEVITVSALADFDGASGGNGSPTCRNDEDDTFANFSNYGDDVDIIAPGVCINSTWNDGGYKEISGTSMASPHVAGAAALYKSLNPYATPAQVKSALQNGGSLDWDNSDDGDNTKEKLLDVSGL